MFSRLSRFPAIPHRKCPIIPCPSKIMLSDTTSALSISKGRAPVRGLRSKSRPFVIAAELSIAIFCYNRFPPVYHFGLHVKFPSAFLGLFPVETMSRGDRSLRDDVPANGCGYHQPAPAALRTIVLVLLPGKTPSRGHNQQPLGRQSRRPVEPREFAPDSDADDLEPLAPFGPEADSANRIRRRWLRRAPSLGLGRRPRLSADRRAVRARPEQLLPDGSWRVWLLMAGRGFGKTRCGAEWVRAEVKAGVVGSPW